MPSRRRPLRVLKVPASDHQKVWALKRIDNMRRLSKEVIKDDQILFRAAADLLHDMADLASNLGDDELGMYIGVMSNRFDTKAKGLDRKKKRKSTRAR